MGNQQEEPVTKQYLDDRPEDQDVLIQRQLEHHRKQISEEAKEREQTLISEVVRQVVPQVVTKVVPQIVRDVVPLIVNKVVSAVVSKMDKRVERRFEKQEQMLVRHNGVLVENVAVEFREIAQDQLTDLKEKSRDHEEQIDTLEQRTGVRI